MLRERQSYAGKGVNVDSRRAAEHWFLRHGLPYVLRSGALLRSMWARSAPALAGFSVLAVSSALVVAMTGEHTVDIPGRPTRSEWFVLVIVILVLPAATMVGAAVARLETNRSLRAAASASVIVATIGALLGGPTPRVIGDLIFLVAAVALILVCTATGLGSLLGWAFRVTFENLALAGSLFARALPVLLLTFLVFFNTLVWVMSALISRPRLWLALAFLFGIAVTFLVTSTLEHVRPILNANASMVQDFSGLAGTPFENMPDRPKRSPLTRLERLNIITILAMTQIIQLMAVALVTSSIFFVLGLIVIDARMLEAWTHDTTTSGNILGMTFPVPQALIQITLFLTAVTFMYLAALAVSDSEYRSRFHDPLLTRLEWALVARDRYRTITHKGP